MWYECQWDNSLSKSQFMKVSHYMSMYGLQQGVLAHTQQQAIKGHKNDYRKTIQTGKIMVLSI